MKDITKRFIDVYEFLLNQKKVTGFSDFADKIAVSTSTITEICKGRTNAGINPIQNTVRSFPEIDSNWLLTGVGSMLLTENTGKTDISVVKDSLAKDNSLIPLIPIDAVAGKGINHEIQISEKDIIDGYLIPDFTQRGVEYIIRVSGSSMYPKYSSGDLLGCKKIQETSFFQWGKVYVLDTDQGPMVKRLFQSEQEGYLICKSDNEDYPPFEINTGCIFSYSIVVGVLRLE